MMASLSLLVAASSAAQAAEPTLKVSSASVTITKTADKVMAFTVEQAGTLIDTDGSSYALEQAADCLLDLPADSLTCTGSTWIDSDEADLALTITAEKAVLELSGASWKPSDAALAVIGEDFVGVIEVQSIGAIKGWSWPDSGLPGMFIEWILENIFARDDVQVRIDGYCVTCIDNL